MSNSVINKAKFESSDFDEFAPMLKVDDKYLKRSKYIAGIICNLLVLCYCSGYAQSDNYWSWNFNTASTLLAGAVVGGGAGQSAVFYNPSLIDHELVPSLSLSASIISFQFLKVENIAGTDINANVSTIKIQPKFLSYKLPSKNKKIGMEAAILSPVSEEMSYTIQHFDQLNVIQRTAGLETYSGYLSLYRKYNDTWAGFGLSYKLSDNFYLGGSAFISLKILDYNYRQLAEAYQETDSVLILNNLEPKYITGSGIEEQLDYWDTSLIFKFGGQYISNNEQFSAGINITLPNIPLIGEANVRKAFSQSNVYDNTENSFTPNEILIEVEDKITPRVKNPFSIAFGIQYFSLNKRSSISLTMEYFNKIDQYAIVESSLNNIQVPKYLEGIISGNDFMSYYFAAKSLTNVAIGFKQYIYSKLDIMGGFRTDFTASPSENVRFVGDKFKLNQIHMDKYHLTIGPSITFERLSLVTGVQYTVGRNKEMLQVINYSDPVEYNPNTRATLQGTRQKNAVASINEFALFFGLTVNFNN